MIAIQSALASVVALVRGRLPEDKERGATAVEYGLMVALIAAVIASVVILLGNNLHSKFNTVQNCVGTPNATNCPASNG